MGPFIARLHAANRKSGLKKVGKINNRRGTKVRFRPDKRFLASRSSIHARLQMARVEGLSVCWCRNPLELRSRIADQGIEVSRRKKTFHFPEGLRDILSGEPSTAHIGDPGIFVGKSHKQGGHGSGRVGGRVRRRRPTASCRPTATRFQRRRRHARAGMRTALLRGLKRSRRADRTSKRAAPVTSEDVMVGARHGVGLYPEPEFQGQTKDGLQPPRRIASSSSPSRTNSTTGWRGSRPPRPSCSTLWSNRRMNAPPPPGERGRAKERDQRKLRLPGKLADSPHAAQGSEISSSKAIPPAASAKQARDRASQAVLPLRGKILNVASPADKLSQNQQLVDLIQALGCGTGTVIARKICVTAKSSS